MTSQSKSQSQIPQPSSLRPRGSTRSSPALRSSKFAFQPSSSDSPLPFIAPVPEQRSIHDDSVNGPGLVQAASQPRKLKKSPSRSGIVFKGKELAERRVSSNGNLGDHASQCASACEDGGVSSKIGDSRLGAKNWGPISKQEADSSRTRTAARTSLRRVSSAAPPIFIANLSVSAAVSNKEEDLVVPDTKADRPVTATFSNSSISSSSTPRTSLLPPPRVRAVTLNGPAVVASKNATSIPIKSANITPPKSTAPTPKFTSRPTSSSTLATPKSRSAPSSPPPPSSTVTPIPAVPPKPPFRTIPSSGPVASSSSSISTTAQTRTRSSVSKSPSTSNLVRKPSTNQPLPRSRYSSMPGPGPKVRSPSPVLSPSSKLKPLLLSPHASSARVTQTNPNRKREIETLGGAGAGNSTVDCSPGKKKSQPRPAAQDMFHGVAMNAGIITTPNPTLERQLKSKTSLSGLGQPPLSRKPSIAEPSQRISTRSSTATVTTTPMMESSIAPTSVVSPKSLFSSPRSSMSVSPKSTPPSYSNTGTSPKRHARASVTLKPSLVTARPSVARTASSSSTPSTSALAPTPASSPSTSPPPSLTRKTGNAMQLSAALPESVQSPSALKSPRSPNSGTTAAISTNTVNSPSRSATSSVKGPREPKASRSRKTALKSVIGHTPTSPSHHDPSSPSASLRKPHDASLLTTLTTKPPEIPPPGRVPSSPKTASSNSLSSIISAYTSLPSSSPITLTVRESSYSTESSAQPPPSISSVSSSDTPSSPRSTYAAPAPSSIFGTPLSMGTDPSRRERGLRKPIPSFGSSTLDVAPKAEGDGGDDWETWRTSSASSDSYRTFRTARQITDEDGRCSNGDPGGSSAAVLSADQSLSSSAATKPPMFLLPELSFGDSLLSDEPSLRAISVDLGEGQVGSDQPSALEEDPAPSDKAGTAAAIRENSASQDMVAGSDQEQTAESRRRVSSSPTSFVRFPSEEHRSEARPTQLRTFNHHSSRSLSPQSPSGCRSSTLQKLPYNDMKQLLSKPSGAHSIANPRVPSISFPSSYSPLRPLQLTSMNSSVHSNDPHARPQSPSFTLSPSEAGTVDGSDTPATPAEEIMVAYKRQTQRHREIERSIKEAERMVQEMEREAETEAEERLKVKALRDAELERGKQEISIRGDYRLHLQAEAKSTSATQSPLPTPPEDFVGVSLHNGKAGKSVQGSPPPSTPYHTVFGSSGTVVAVGDPEDPDLQLSWSPSLGKSLKPGFGTNLGPAIPGEPKEVWDRAPTVTMGKPNHSKSRSHETSTKPGGDIATSTTTTGSTESYDLDTRARSASMDRSHPKRRSLAQSPPLSTDDYSHTALVAIQPELPPRESCFSTSLPTPASATTLSPTSPGYGGSRSRIWSIVKRISTGALRDKYSRSSEGPSSPTRSPPVPALPGQVAKKMTSTDALTSSDLTGSTSVDLHQEPPQNVRSRRSTGIDKSGTATGVRATGTQNSPGATARSSSSTKPSTATRSSSPISSSDMTSSQSSALPRSSRSSASSYRDELPPLPSNKTKHSSPPHASLLQKYILSPSELSKLQASIENEQDASAQSRKQALSRPSLPTTMAGLSPTSLDSSSQSKISYTRGYGLQPPADDWMIVSTPADEKPPFSLPIPPSKSRRKEKEYRTAQSEDFHSTSPSTPDFSIAISRPRESDNLSASPTIPKFSITTPANSSSKKADATSWKSSSKLKLPARPSTAPTAPSPSSMKPLSRAPSPIAELSPSAGPSSPTTPKKAKDDYFLLIGRKNTSSIPTFNGRSMFRELPDSQTRQRTALTEQEKADKWDALLEKSAAAGGTLHIRPGAHLLESDNLRFSITDSELDL